MSSESRNSLAADRLPPQRLLGTVLATQANYYQVQLDLKQLVGGVGGVEGTQECKDTGNSQAKIPNLKSKIPLPLTLLCTRRSRLKKLGQRVMVGDRVEIEEPDWGGGTGSDRGRVAASI